ncbi:hypothetical protein M011DRAFT_467907 [Sporormia fimetaria CBS 119925]|uniref:RNA polymerase II assembly factor Rtp1 C-terminal domain-containing protein n=1 Tax=Sporormia fimetaria CBS 119925 TaxID=1340428 RepID=A0A6A6VE41_9PLEO|nr:hypothetical protein M011DRAFT_467907 [Sporormia fimetaria CBS 119925]
MGSEQEVIDDAVEFIRPYLYKDQESRSTHQLSHDLRRPQADKLLGEALDHLQKVNAADKKKAPDAPYDGALVGIVYGLLDLITFLGIHPFLSQGVEYPQRPRSVLLQSVSIPRCHDDLALSRTLLTLLGIVRQEGTGIHPLVAQRILPDIVSGVAELAFSPRAANEYRETYTGYFETLLASTSTSRLFQLLSSWVQHDVPLWLRQPLAKNLAAIPLRPHGVRSTVEFLSMSYLSKNNQMPPSTGDGGGQIQVPLEAIGQAARLLACVPSGMTAEEWFTQLSHQLFPLLDGNEGIEFSRAAGQIIGFILNRKSIGAPGTIGWRLFAEPILRAVSPQPSANSIVRESTSDRVVVEQRELESALKRLATISSSTLYTGVLKRLVGPLLLPLWALMEHAQTRPSLDAQYERLPRVVLTRYISIACEPRQLDTIMTNLFWDGGSSWEFGPGVQGGVEIRMRAKRDNSIDGMGEVLARLGDLDRRVNTFVLLLEEAKVDDETAGALFLQTTNRWLVAAGSADPSKASLLHDEHRNSLDALVDAKLSEAMASKFREKFARSPRHIFELMSQLLQNFVGDHKKKSSRSTDLKRPNRAALKHIVNHEPAASSPSDTSDAESDELASFALSILNNLLTSPDFRVDEKSPPLLSNLAPSLEYLSQPQAGKPMSPLVVNAATNVLHLLQPTNSTPGQKEDPKVQYRATLKSALTELHSPEPPNRTWALSELRKLVQNPDAFAIIDVPSITHLLLSVSLADAESYVHLAAIPVLVALAIRAPNPTVRILIDAFVDIEERSLRLRKEQDIQEAVDFRLRVGEVLNQFITEDDYWVRGDNISTRFPTLKMILDAALSVSSRRGQRKKTLAKRDALAEAERKETEEAEAAWSGPIPNLLDPEAEDLAAQRERDALLKIVQGWEETGSEEDVRIRASALSVLSTVMEHRLELLSQVSVDASLQMVLQILVIETGVAKAILRRSAVLVILGLLRAMDALLENGREATAGLSMKHTEEVEKVIGWVSDEDGDELVRGHAHTVLEGLETWRMKKLFKAGDGQSKIGSSFGLEGGLQGLSVNLSNADRKRRAIVEEIE